MKSAPKDQKRLLDLQGLDTAIEKIKHSVANLEVHQIISDLMQKRTQTGDDLIAAQTELSDLVVAAERAEADVVPVRERLARNQARVDAGQVDSKALQSAIDEVAHLKQRISDLEDCELEALEAVEQARVRVEEMTHQGELIETDLHAHVDKRDAEVGELAAKAKALAAERVQVAGEIAEDLVGLYEKIRTRSAGIGVGSLQGRRCSGCGLEATVADYNAYLAAPEDQVIRCAECDRILIR
ncbi:MAG: C4-type zinc ribbon domain-containing protein [Propionibacteriaceae bacterium]|jgi:predicted  nucleic acid-binding Zn-ribbon protein|nr:C4-type zinc ribbon domain-containing protein [Propionibacteriaceae bacterium]